MSRSPKAKESFDFANVAVTGAIATAASSALLPLLGALETGHAAATMNATSHILWGKRAQRQDEPSLRYTASGAALNAGAMGSWALVQELLFGKRVRGSVGKAFLSGVVTSAIAYVTDYHLVPKRFTPGFEARLSRGAMLAVYGTLAASLSAGMLLRGRNADAG